VESKACPDNDPGEAGQAIGTWNSARQKKQREVKDE